MKNSTLKPFILTLLLVLTQLAFAQEPKQCSMKRKDGALAKQMQSWFQAAQIMSEEVHKFSAEFQVAYQQPGFDAQIEERFRLRWEEMDKRHRDLYVQANKLVFSAQDLLKNSHNQQNCENALSTQTENLRLMQTSLYNDLLEADPMTKAAARALSPHSS